MSYVPRLDPTWTVRETTAHVRCCVLARSMGTVHFREALALIDTADTLCHASNYLSVTHNVLISIRRRLPQIKI